jgi:putative glutamine amidotransferase
VKKRKKKRSSIPLKISKKTKPVIGITCEVVKLKPYYAEFELVCDYRYIRAIIRAGGLPVLLPVNPLKRDIPKIFDFVDGLVIIGGADIHPHFYGDKSREKIKPIYRGRTYFDMRLYHAARKKKIPVLAICYGMQLLNVICGGTLHQDIPTEVKGALNHRSRRNPLHRVDIQPGSLCAKIFRKKSMMVHSEHHQSVKLPGQSLRVTAVSEDGIPEAVEGPEHTIAVQWHPERQAKDPLQTRLFKYYMRLARERLKARF